MKPVLSVAACVWLSLLTAAAQGQTLSGDPVRGKQRHEPCLQCHGTELYVAPKARIKSLKALKRSVEKWGDYYNPRYSKQDVEDVVAYLNAEFYKFDK
jgi:mono/diheme cytochrome c family protein